MSSKSLLYIVSRAPYSNAVGQEALDAILIGASFEQAVTVLFMHDGVFQLHANQGVGNSELKQYTKAFDALEDFGIAQVVCHDLSLIGRGLSQNNMMRRVDLATSEQVKTMISKADKVFTF